MSRRELLPLGAVVLVYAGFSALTLMDYPPVYSDEPWLLSSPISLLRDGRNALPMFGESYSASLYFNAYLVPFLGVLGVSIETGRVVAVAHGVGVLVVAWLLARELGAGSRAWLAAALVLTAFPFVWVSRYVRPEAIETFYSLLAVWLYVRSRGRGDAWVFAAGTAAGFAAGLSLKSAWVVVLLAVWAAFDRRLRRLGLLVAGTAVALLPLLVFVASDPGEYGRFLRKFGGSSVFSERYESDPVSSFGDLIRREPQRYESFAAAADSRFYVACVVALVVVGIGFAVRRRQWLLVLLALLPVIEFALLAENKTHAYLMIAAPGFAVLATLALARSRDVVVALAVAAVALSYVGVLRGQLPDVRTSFGEVRERYRSAVTMPPGSLVIALPNAYAYYLNDPVDFRALHYFTDFEDFELDSAEEARRKLDRERRPIYLLRNQALLDTLAQFSRQHRLPDGLRSLLEDDFRTVATIRLEDTASGTFEDTIAVYAPRGAG